MYASLITYSIEVPDKMIKKMIEGLQSILHLQFKKSWTCTGKQTIEGAPVLRVPVDHFPLQYSSLFVYVDLGLAILLYVSCK